MGTNFKHMIDKFYSFRDSIRAISLLLLTSFAANQATAQLTVTTSSSAVAMASAITGSGVTVFNQVLDCDAPVACGTFSVVPGTLLGTGTTVFGINSGILLTTGHATAAAGAETGTTSFNNGFGGDATMAALALTATTYDRCELSFDFVPKGDSVNFNYIFGSEEYIHSTCGSYDDAFAFFISGPGITGTQNMALIPGTNVPVLVNTVNCGAPCVVSGYGTYSNCTSIAAGSPFTSYYVDNTGGTRFAYRGYTTRLRAVHDVIPCDTYHLKMAIVDAGNGSFDSGVFIEAGSLNSGTTRFNHSVGIGATINGIPNAIVKGCTPASITVVSTPASASATTITLGYGGTGTLGTDYSSPATVTIPAGDTTATFTLSGLPTFPAGTKTAVVYLSSACSGHADSVIVNLLDTPSARILTPDTAICGGSVVIRTSGTAGLTYSWAPAATLSSGIAANPTATPTATTTYTLTATLPGSGCPPITREVTISESSVTIAMITPDTSICLGSALPLQVSGSGTYAYSWTPATGLSSSTVQNPIASPTATTTYTVTATPPGTGCGPASATVTITVQSLSDVLLTADTTVCAGASFTIRETASPGAAFNWSPAAGLSSTTVADPTATPTGTITYIVTVTLPGSSCPPITKEFTVTVPDVAIAVITPDTTICKGQSAVIRTAGTSGLIYHWTPATGLNSTTIADPTATPTTTTTYTVVASIPGAECSGTASVTVTVAQPSGGILSPHSYVCGGDSVRLYADTTVPCSYLWTPATGLSTAIGPSPFAQPAVTTTYTLTTATNAYGCKDTTAVVVTVSSAGTVTMSEADSIFCIGTYNTLKCVPTPGYTQLVWNFGNGDSVADMADAVYAYPAIGTYTVSIAAYYGGCPSSSESMVVHVYNSPRIDLGPDTTFCPGSNPICLNDRINVGAGGAQWSWSTGEHTPSICIVAPGVYYATVKLGGCTATDSVVVLNDCYLDIPNAFTPNGDGINDYFFPRQLLSRGLTYFHMTIFNRWGESVFETSTLDGRGWDGCFNGVPQPEGVFIYMIEAAFKDGQKEQHKGNVSLLR